MNYRLILQYDGSRYDGWQRQGNTEKTVQGKIEEVLSRLLEEPVEIDGAGRTDAGVHALGQTANFHTERKLDPEELKAALNQFLPEDIGVLRAEEVPERFHSRLNARGKTYRYRVATGEEKNVFERKQIYPLDQTLDVDAMRRGAALMIGEKDFRGFSSMKKTKKSTVPPSGIHRNPGSIRRSASGIYRERFPLQYGTDPHRHPSGDRNGKKRAGKCGNDLTGKGSKPGRFYRSGKRTYSGGGFLPEKQLKILV